jgi:hypothetical protein
VTQIPNRELYIKVLKKYLDSNRLFYLTENFGKGKVPYRIIQHFVEDYHGVLIIITIKYKKMDDTKGRAAFGEFITRKLDSYFAIKHYKSEVELRLQPD